VVGTEEKRKKKGRLPPGREKKKAARALRQSTPKKKKKGNHIKRKKKEEKSRVLAVALLSEGKKTATKNTRISERGGENRKGSRRLPRLLFSGGAGEVSEGADSNKKRGKKGGA